MILAGSTLGNAVPAVFPRAAGTACVRPVCQQDQLTRPLEVEGDHDLLKCAVVRMRTKGKSPHAQPTAPFREWWDRQGDYGVTRVLLQWGYGWRSA